MPVNVSMERTPQMGAARAARFTSVVSSVVATVALAAMLGASLPAQQDPTTTPGYRLAQAKLAEAQGDVATARRTLEDALAKANDADKAALREALAALPQAGKAATVDEGMIQKLLDDPAAAARVREALAQRGFLAATPEDPVQRLIAVLERGPNAVREVRDAFDQLQNLGPLAVAPLLAALPKAGPFGVVHAINILGQQADPRIAPAILARANSDPAIAHMVIATVDSMSIPVRQALLAGLDEGPLTPTSRWMLAMSLDDDGELAEKRRALVLRLADEPTLQREIGPVLVQWQVPWADEVFAKLRASKDPAIVANATAQWLSLHTELDEPAVQAAIQALDPGHRWWVARQVTTRSKHWAKVALLGLGEGANNKQLHQDPWFLGVEWRYGGGEAAIALLDAAKNQPDLGKAIRPQVSAIVMSGWGVPPEQEAALAALGSTYLAVALPKDDEARALAAWQRLERADRASFVSKVVELERPWHRVVAAQLATVERYEDVQDEWLRRDWTGATPEVGEALVSLAERFAMTPGRLLPRTKLERSSAWQGALIEACMKHEDLPWKILVPLVHAGAGDAWGVLTQRAPEAALALARRPGHRLYTRLPRLLSELGTAADVPTLLNALAADVLDTAQLAGLEPFVQRHCRGNLEVLVLLAKRADKPASQLLDAVVEGLQISQLAELLEQLPQLPRHQFYVVKALLPKVDASHAPILVRALANAATREPHSIDEIRAVLQLIDRCSSAECLPALRRILANEKLSEVRGYAGKVMIANAGAERSSVIRELLACPDVRVVATALAAEGLGQDAELLAAATKALLANLHALDSVDAFFDGLDPAARADTARAVLQATDFPQSSEELAQCTLRALGGLKDSRFAADLARGAQHHDASVRLAAAEQLGRLFTRDAAPFLLELLKDDDKAVRTLAKERLDLLADYLDGEAKWNERLHRK